MQVSSASCDSSLFSIPLRNGINASTISINSRVSRGVKLMKMDDNSKVATISRAPHEEESYNDNDDDDSQSGEQFFAESPIESQTIIE